jgi:protoporphyrinogen oxidase
MSEETHVAVIGAGPAGLTAAYLLRKRGIPVTVLEADPQYVGGISRTVNYKGFHFDIGGHRFFSKSQQVEDFWTEILGGDMLTRPRSSRIFYNRKFFDYPLNAREALFKLGLLESLRCGLSYLKARCFPVRNPDNFEDWVSNQFGKRLFNIFFKTYTEKVWGMSCKDISADWAAQRIKGLSLSTAILSALLPAKRGDGSIKTLISSFRYPRKGPGMMWEVCAEKIKAMSGHIYMGARVTRCEYESATQNWTVSYTTPTGVAQTIQARHLISSAPARELAKSLSPALSSATLQAATSLKYRDFITVVLILRERNIFSDNWIYVHDPDVKVGRIQNFKSWSPEMVPDPSMACYGLEYFCFEGDGLWTAKDKDLIALASRELETLGLAKATDVQDGCVIRQPKAYPVYDDHYRDHVSALRTELETRFPTLHLVGRNGMHKYNNQDHSMMTAMLTVENIAAGKTIYDVWNVNEDAEYHETQDTRKGSAAGGLRQVPMKVASE